MKPRQIEIRAGQVIPKAESKQIAAKQQAA
jgi:hypothetical protein